MLTSREMRALALSLFLTLVFAAPAMAGDNGEGWAGETDDKIVTLFSLGVLVFFVLVVVIGTIIQSRLEKRKDEQKAHALRQREGW
jgi:hypothetical protein